ncbi:MULTISPECIES: hypothetical protein [unclassified Streptomyces]|uniref:hypothetical protein n=1 Tax=unclassified Streptomyces TaxID=2593676 RepID=UPI001F397629|nr:MULTISPECIES: hypothetical protein [unclassified Streptomyces]MCF0088379.1 hypothetical protein [Streptomyces sp. MH192]MCF0103537.1 hypothetical protein [Streptomyces sp. MH191]
MTVDPTDPETFEREHADTEVGVEAPEDDAAEQLADVVPQRDERPRGDDTDRASEADLAEQARVVELDEDDYR